MTLVRPQPSGSFEWAQAGGGAALRCRTLSALADHLFTTRPWRLGSQAPDARDEGWAEVAAAMAVDPADLGRLHQVHGANAIVVARGARAPWPPADIQVTGDSSVALAVQTADCLPILLADPRTGAVAAAHAGWRGLAARVPEAAVGALVQEFGSRPSDLVAAIGPAIGACCYEVGIDVREAFRAAGFADEAQAARWFFDEPQPTAVNPSLPSVSGPRRPNHWFFDSWAAARYQLERACVPADRIYIAALCTASHPDLFCSYRRDGRPAGRMAGVIRRKSVVSSQ
jgi:polyphenol oxidase